MASLLRMKRGVTPVEREEEQMFLPDGEQVEEDRGTSFHWTKNQSPSTSAHTFLPVYSNIHL
jgi:hypothetical protein